MKDGESRTERSLRQDDCQQEKLGGMDLEFLSKASSWANAAVVVFTVLAAAAGVVAWHFSSQYKDAKDAAFERFKLQSAVSIAESAVRTAEATKRASEAGEETAKAVAEAASANERTKA
jgi:hypothetical protein